MMSMHPDMERALARTPLTPGPVDQAYLAAIEAYRQDPRPEVVYQVPAVAWSKAMTGLKAIVGA